MKKTIALLLLLLWPCFSRAQSNVLYATLADFGISVDTNVQMTLTLVSPKNRTINNVLISNGPKTATTDTNGYFSFTNIAWGNYFLQASDTGSTRWPLQVWTNTVGDVQLASLITNSMTLPPNSASNYLTQAQIQALFSGVTRGLGSPDGSVTITATNLGDGTFSYGLQVVGGGSATNVLFGASTNIMTYLFGGTNYFYVPGGTFYPYSGNPAGFLTSSSLTPYALISSLGNAAYGDTNLMSVLHATNADNAVTAVNLSGNISGAQVTSGTVADARLSANVALLNGTQMFSGANTFSNPPAINTAFGANIMSPTNENFWQGRQYADQAVWGTPVGYEPWTILGASGGQEANMIAAAQNISNYNLTAYAPGGFYVDITDGWATNAPLNPNPNWFPDGLPYLISTYHAYGLKIGPYLEPNATMSAGDPGMTNYDQTASWLVRSNTFDFVRFDQPGVNSLQNCVTNMQRLYNAIHQYTSKPFPIFSFVSPSAPKGLGTNADLNCLAALPPNSTIFIAGDWDAQGFSIFQVWTNYMYELTNVAYQASQFVKPGRSIGLFYAQNNYQNDPDIVSRGIVDGYALMHFPMILTAVGGFTGPLQQQITTNQEVWSVANDPSYFQPQILEMATDHIVISRQMMNGDRVVGMFNTLTNQSVNIGFNLQQLGFNNDGTQYIVREMSWQTNCGTFTSSYTSSVPAMEMRFLRVSPVNPNYLGNNLSTPVKFSGSISSELGGQPLNAGLVFDMPLLEGGGSTVVDRVGGVTGALTSLSYWTNGLTGYGVGSYSGSDVIYCQTNTMTNFTAVTMDAIFKSTNSGITTFPVRITLNSLHNLSLVLNPTSLGYAYFYVDGLYAYFPMTNLITTTNVWDGNWHELTGTYAPPNLSIYCDGMFESSSNIGTLLVTNKSDSFLIGNLAGGVQSRVRIWNRALTAAQVTNLWLSTFPYNPTSSNSYSGTFTGNGSGVTNVPAASMTGTVTNPVNTASSVTAGTGFYGDASHETNANAYTALGPWSLTSSNAVAAMIAAFASGGAGFPLTGNASAAGYAITALSTVSANQATAGNLTVTNTASAASVTAGSVSATNGVTGASTAFGNTTTTNTDSAATGTFGGATITNAASIGTANVTALNGGNLVASNSASLTNLVVGGTIKLATNSTSIGNSGPGTNSYYTALLAGSLAFKVWTSGTNNFTIGPWNFIDTNNAGLSYGNAILSGASNAMFTAFGDCYYSFIGGGFYNTVDSPYSVIVGGQGNQISDQDSYDFIGGGYKNLIDSSGTAVLGGENNYIGSLSDGGTIGGGFNNSIGAGAVAAQYSVILGGISNSVSAPHSLAAGTESTASHAGSLVWSDSLGGGADSTSNQFVISAHGGVVVQNGQIAGNGSGLYGVQAFVATNIPIGILITNPIVKGGSISNSLLAPNLPASGQVLSATDTSGTNFAWVTQSGGGSLGSSPLPTNNITTNLPIAGAIVYHKGSADSNYTASVNLVWTNEVLTVRSNGVNVAGVDTNGTQTAVTGIFTNAYAGNLTPITYSTNVCAPVATGFTNSTSSVVYMMTILNGTVTSLSDPNGNAITPPATNACLVMKPGWRLVGTSLKITNCYQLWP